MQRGTIKFFNETKGYGFITKEGSTEEVFVHSSATEEKLEKGDKVTFDVERTKRGLSAIDVKKVS